MGSFASLSFEGHRKFVASGMTLRALLSHARARQAGGADVEIVSHAGKTYVGVGEVLETVGAPPRARGDLPTFYHVEFFSPSVLHYRSYPTVYEWDGGAVFRMGQDDGPLESHPLVVGTAGPFQQDREEMAGRFSKAQRYFGAGVLEKLVISAKRSYFVNDFDAIAAVATLAERYPFLAPYLNPAGFGASPELVAQVERGSFLIQPLAGTASVGEEQRLMHSTKDHFEHAVMVDQLISDLHNLVSRIQERPAPQVVQAGPLIHLMTELRGVLLEGVTLGDVLAGVAPTAAVSGVPRQRAMKVLEEIEGDRGAYGGCVGLVDGAGNGFAYLAIRGGSWSQGRVELRAGVGCVRESRFDREWEETKAKFEVTAVALGWR